jgi:hypothetical protein
MPFRLGEGRTKMQFLTSAEMPSMCFDACSVTGTPSITRYIQIAVCERLAKDLGEDLDEMLSRLPPTRPTVGEFNDHKMVGPANTYEEVR